VSSSYSYKFPQSLRSVDTFAHRWIITPLAAIFLYLLVPGLFGVLSISFIDIFLKLSGFKGKWSVIAIVTLFDLIGILLICLVGTTREAAIEVLKGLDHAVRRTLSILVVGLSDLVFRGHTWAALCIYWAFFWGQLVFGLKFIVWAANLKAVKSVVAALFSSTLVFEASLINMFITGEVLIYALVFLLLPFLTAGIPAWRNMTMRPVLKVIDEKNLPAAGGSSKVVYAAQITDLHVTEAVPDANDPNVLALTEAGKDVEIIALTGDH
jgi:hypothetical protein